MREQREQRVAHHAERRLAAGGQQQAQEAVDLVVGEPLAVDLGVHEIGEEVAGRLARAAPRRAVAGSRPSPALAAMPALGRQRTGVDLLGPLRELRGVLERHADDPADHLHRILRRDRRDEVGAPERRDRVEQPVDRSAARACRPSARAATRGTPWRRGCGTCGARRRSCARMRSPMNWPMWSPLIDDENVLSSRSTASASLKPVTW